MANRKAIVIGAGIVGLAITRALAKKEFSVKVFERSSFATGASVRNFGMVWPVGQPTGELYERALRSRSIWKEIADTGAFWSDAVGSLHVAHDQLEWNVLQELYEEFKTDRPVQLFSAAEVMQRSEAVVETNLFGGLYSADELIVDPREAIASLPGYLESVYNVEFYWNKCVSYIADNTVYIGNEEDYEADIIFICSGADFETLYPEDFANYPITKCKLQMMRMQAQPGNWRIGPALCGGLSLIHYNSFKIAESLPLLKAKYSDEMEEYIDWGIHVMVSQNEAGELTIGDSHEYGATHDPFDKDYINQLIKNYLHKFATFKDYTVTQTWNGIYSKLTNGDTELLFSPEAGVYVLNGLGGAGMTLSFGLAEEVVAGL
ncbi:TIGR03364 family FAD-dependent oxidoreductase [Lacibacter luteus]|uniref:TIGR03364 family FAD-dependent oxidoreductase n=1 Tax=Lacibacter luteus TaxID=2508719 RepID=A0A4Q1CGV7_9BACT|nr:TIGR03364 family FAD-dependent oxidoreductase [Lacibacter luteus]RXK59352.1 TIGR03364 family FAD-dependent oxidoreductase [Lacibacter luteus]